VPVSVRDALLSMGHPATVVDAVIARVGGASLERCLDEIRRMTQAQDALELKNRITKENEAKLAQERQRVRQTDPKPPSPTAQKSEAPLSPRSRSAGADGPCTLQLVIDEDKSTFVGKFKAGDTLRAVCDFVIEKVPAAAQKTIAFETVLPRQLFESSRFGEALNDLGLTPRARVIVKYL
jgi:hypothetical protein